MSFQLVCARARSRQGRPFRLRRRQSAIADRNPVNAQRYNCWKVLLRLVLRPTSTSIVTSKEGGGVDGSRGRYDLLSNCSTRLKACTCRKSNPCTSDWTDCNLSANSLTAPRVDQASTEKCSR